MTRPRLYQVDFDVETYTTGTHTLDASDGVVLANTAGGSITFNLPECSTVPDRAYYILKISAANTVILDPNGAQTIDGAATLTLSDLGEWVMAVCDGVSWRTLAGSSHDAVTLDADAAVLLDITGQELGLDTQAANTFFAGPIAGGANEPTFREIEVNDITELLSFDNLVDVGIVGAVTGDVPIYSAGDWENYPLGVGTSITNDGTQIQIGDVGGGNYTAISDTSGEIRLFGDAQVWDDLQVTVIIRNTGAATRDPTYTKWFDNGAGSRGVYVYGFGDEAVNEKELTFTLQMTHRQDPTADVHLHVHWIGDTTADPAVVKWGLEYTWVSPLEVFGNTTIVYATALEADTSTGITQYKHNITEFNALTPGVTQDDLSSILIGRVFRNSSDAGDTYTGGVAGLLAIDAHVLIDSLGSAEEYTKYEDLGNNLLLESGDNLLLENGDLLLLEA